MAAVTGTLRFKGSVDIPDPSPPPPDPSGLILVGAYKTGYQAELTDRMMAVDYPRQGPAIWNEVLSLLVPDIRKGDVIFAWGSIQATNELRYCVEFSGEMRLSPMSGNWRSGEPIGTNSGYNLTPQLFDYPYDLGGVGEFPGMHHGMHQRHGFHVATADMGNRRVVYGAYAGGSSHTVPGEYLVIDKQGHIVVQHFRPIA